MYPGARSKAVTCGANYISQGETENKLFSCTFYVTYFCLWVEFAQDKCGPSRPCPNIQNLCWFDGFRDINIQLGEPLIQLALVQKCEFGKFSQVRDSDCLRVQISTR